MKIAIGLAALGCAALTACSSGVGSKPADTAANTPKTPTTFSMSGTLTLDGSISTSDETPADGVQCYGYQNDLGDPDYESLVAGATVTVYDQNHQAVGDGTLDPGTMSNASPPNGRHCAFNFALDGIPAGKLFYTVEIADNPVGSHFKQVALEAGIDLDIKSLAYDGS